MKIEIFWSISPPDGPYPWEPNGRWTANFDTVKNAAQQVDTLGFEGVLVAIGSHRIYDGWTLASMLAPMTTNLKFLIAVYPGLIAPTQLALMARTFDDLSGGRLMFNIVGGNPKTLAAHGFDIPKAERYDMLTEYWDTFRKVYAGEEPGPDLKYFKTVDPLSQFHHIPPTQKPYPPLWGAGGSPEGLKAVTGLADTYLSINDTPEGIRKKMEAAVKVAKETHGRTMDLGVNFPVIVRETEEEAWVVAKRQLTATSMETITGGTGWAATKDPDVDLSDPAVARCVEAIRNGKYPDVRDLEVYPNIWCGPNLVNGLDVTRTVPGPGAMLVGSAQQVADRIHEIREVAGVSKFILSGRPSVEEAYYVSNLLMPLLDLKTPRRPLSEKQDG